MLRAIPIFSAHETFTAREHVAYGHRPVRCRRFSDQDVEELRNGFTSRRKGKCAIALRCGGVSFKQRDRRSRKQSHKGKAHCGDRPLVARQEFARSIPAAFRIRRNGLIVEVAFDILRKSVHGRIALCRIGLRRFDDDGGEIGPQRVRGAQLPPIGRRTGQQLEQQDSKRVDVRGRGHLAAVDLLR